MKLLHLAFFTAAIGVRLSAQTPPAETHVLRGVLSTASGAPVAGANVFLLESLDATLSDSAGRFSLRTSAKGQVTLVARRIGYAPRTVVVPADTNAVIALTLVTQ